MIKTLYILFVISILAPIFTYAIYPLLLKLFRAHAYRTDAGYKPHVSVIITAVGSAESVDIEKKRKNIAGIDYPADLLDVSIVHSQSELRSRIASVPGEIVLFTDTETEIGVRAVANLISRFADDRIGCVCGQLRKKPDQDGNPTDGVFWKYENMVKSAESRIGRLSGANSGLYAVRKNILPVIGDDVIHVDFYIATSVLQAGYDVVMDETAPVYEKPNDSIDDSFNRHVRDGAGYYQALAVFWRMLLPRKGSFVYWSHRVLKWLVPFNMIIAFAISAILMLTSKMMTLLFVLQALAYLLMILYYVFVAKQNRKPRGTVGKLTSLAFYFVSINLALFLGWLKYISGRQTAVWETQR